MARPRRNKIKFDEESVNDLLQEIYNDSHNIKARIARLFTKWENKVKEGGEIQAIGDQIVKLIAAEAKNQDQKIMLLKYLKDVVFDNKAKAGNSDTKETKDDEVSSDRRNELIQMVQNEMNKSKK
jgi:membrane-bound lytic murein transglycosylase